MTHANWGHRRQSAGRPSPLLRTLGVALILVAGVLVPVIASGPVQAAASNPIVTENQQPGSTGWQFDYDALGNPLKATRHEIEGYAAATSVNKGSSIDLMVSLSSAAQYQMQIYRMGFYATGVGCTTAAPCGGRLMQAVTGISGAKQANCPTTTTTTANFGRTECNWTAGYTLTVPTTWTTGNYIVKLIRGDTGMESYVTFVVRDDAGPADIVLSMDVTTWQAYNFWGGAGNGNIGYNLYGQFNDSGATSNTSSQRAYAVSFNRPYLDQGATDGAGNFMVWDYPLVRWLEKNGYNVTYATDLDIENNPSLLAGRKAFVNTGHDEYYSDNMRANLQGYVNGGAHAALLSANDIYYRVRFANSSTGQTQRTIVCYKNATLDPQSPPTIRWRDLAPPQPENAMVGLLQNGTANDRAFRVYDSTSWIYAGTGLTNYVSGAPVTSGTGQNAIAGLVGYEFDERAANDSSLSSFTSYEPAGLQQVAHSAIPAGDNGVAAFSDATLYTAASGAIVFAAGTMQWSWGLDGGFNDGFCDCNPGYANAKSQQITTNIMNKFLTTTTTPASVSLNPTGLTYASQPLNTTSAAQPVTMTNSGGAPLTISSIAVSGTNGPDFTQTNNCPISPTTLAAGGTCTISATFTPHAAGSRTASLSVTDNAGGSPHTVALTGTGASAPAVSLSPTSLAFSSQQINTASPAQSVTVTNSGSAPLTISSISNTGTNPGDFNQSNTCPIGPSTLAAGGSCTISVSFAPSAAGTQTASLGITDDAASSSQSVAMTGTGTTTPVPGAGLSPTNLTFPSQTVGSTSPAQPVTLTNTGNAPLMISGISLGGANPTEFGQTTTCPLTPATLVAGANCVVNVTFTPAVAGSRTGSLSVADNAAGSPQNVALNGTGASAGVYLTDGFESGALTNWTQQKSSGATIAIESTTVNSGIDAAGLNNASSGQYAGLYADLSGGGHAATFSRFCFSLTGLSGSTVLAQGRDVNGNSLWEVDYDNASKGLDIYFWNGARARTNLYTAANLVLSSKWYCAEVQAKEVAAGHGQVWLNGTSVASTNTDLSATNPYSRLYLWNNGPAGSVYVDDVQVSTSNNGPVGAGAAALPGPAVSLSPTSLTFSSQPLNTVSGVQAITVTNSGTAPLTLTGISVTGTNAGDFGQINTCPLSPSTLAVSGSCAVSVTFTPTATGTRAASLSIVDNATGSPHTAGLTGTGASALTPAVSFSPSSVSFASQTVNTTSAAQAVTITNSGSAPLTISGITVAGANPGDYGQTNNCLLSPSTLAAGASCTASVTFTPLASGTRAASLSVADNAPGSPHTVALTGTGALPAGTYLADGFESGLGLWTTTGNGSATVQSTVVNSGATAAALANTAGQYVGIYANLNGGPQAQTYSRFCFNLASLSGTTVLAQGRDTTGATVWEVDYDGGSKGLDIYLWNGARARTDLYTAANLLLSNKWYCAEVQANETATGHAEVWLNGTSVASANADLSVTNPYSRLYLWNNGANGTVYADDVSVTNAYNGPVGAGGAVPAPAVALSPTSLTFTSQTTGTTSAAQTVTVTNSGTASLTISGLSLAGTNPGDYGQTNNCPLSPSTLAAGATCTASVTFAPTAGGTRTASLSVTDNATGSPHSVALTGTGTAPPAPAVGLSPISLTFTSRTTGTTSDPQSVIVTNSGSAALTITGISLAGTNPGDYGQINNCPLSPSTLAAGASCTASVTFTPTAAGTRTASLSIADNATGSPHTVALMGTGAAPAVALSQTNLTFATQVTGTTSAAQAVTITNSGSAPLTISGITVAGANPGDYGQTNNCLLSPSTLAAGASCTASVTFTPLASGTRAASLSVADNAPGSPHTVALTGTGALPAGTYLADGFESGLGLWTTTGNGSATVQSTVVNSGATAAALANTAGQYVGIYANLNGGPQAQTYSRFCFNLASLSGTTVLAQGRDTTGATVWEVDYDGGSKGLDIYLWNGARARTDLYTAANLLLSNKWYCAEVQANETATGHAEVWLNGTSVASANADLSVTNPYSRLYLWNNGANGTVYADDVSVTNAYNGPVGAAVGP